VVVHYGMRHATGASLSSWFLKAAGLSCSTTTAVCRPSRGHISKTKQDRLIVTIEHRRFCAAFRSYPRHLLVDDRPFLAALVVGWYSGSVLVQRRSRRHAYSCCSCGPTSLSGADASCAWAWLFQQYLPVYLNAIWMRHDRPRLGKARVWAGFLFQ